MSLPYVEYVPCPHRKCFLSPRVGNMKKGVREKGKYYTISGKV
jgi:hypothetical protein